MEARGWEDCSDIIDGTYRTGEGEDSEGGEGEYAAAVERERGWRRLGLTFGSEYAHGVRVSSRSGSRVSGHIVRCGWYTTYSKLVGPINGMNGVFFVLG